MAKRIYDLRAGKVTHSWRRIAAIISEEFPGLNIVPNNQLEGKYLCRDAFFRLQEASEEEMLLYGPFKDIEELLE